jgi:adenosylhomocysteine nucleosidase
MKNLLILMVIFLGTGCGNSVLLAPPPASAQEQMRPWAIIGAFPPEIEYLRSQMTVQYEELIQGRRFFVGELEGRPVVVGVVGVGSVNSSAGTALLIQRFNPRAVIFSGVAGGLGDAEPGDVVLATSLIHYGFGQLTDEGYSPWPTYQPDYVTRNPLYFTPDQTLLSTAQTAGAQLTLSEITVDNVTTQPKIIDGIIESEDVFSEVKSRNEQVRLETGCNTFEEEGAPVAQVCSQLEIPFLIVRGISNRAEEDGFETFQQLSDVAAENANRVVLATLARL